MGEPSSKSPFGRRAPWGVMIAVSLALHGLLGAGLALRSPPEKQERTRVVKVRIVPRRPPAPAPPPPEPEPEPPPVIEPETPREPVKVKTPPKRPPPKRPRKARPPPPPEPAPTPRPPREPPPLMGVSMEGLATAPGGMGFAVPNGQATGARHGKPNGTGPVTRRPAPKPTGAATAPTPLAGVTELPSLIADVKVVYPEPVKRLGIEGKVVLSLLIDARGHVKEIKLVEGLHPDLDREARRAARRLRFRPAKVDGSAVAVRIPYTFHFVLD